jgi:hypothetical protein
VWRAREPGEPLGNLQSTDLCPIIKEVQYHFKSELPSVRVEDLKKSTDSLAAILGLCIRIRTGTYAALWPQCGKSSIQIGR